MFQGDKLRCANPIASGPVARPRLGNVHFRFQNWGRKRNCASESRFCIFVLRRWCCREAARLLGCCVVTRRWCNGANSNAAESTIVHRHCQTLTTTTALKCHRRSNMMSPGVVSKDWIGGAANFNWRPLQAFSCPDMRQSRSWSISWQAEVFSAVSLLLKYAEQHTRLPC